MKPERFRWYEHAACLGMSPLFDSFEPTYARLARKVCARCPVLAECRADELANPGPRGDGTRAGVTRSPSGIESSTRKGENR